MRQSDRQGKWHACCGHEASQQLNIDSCSDYVRGGQAWFVLSEDEAMTERSRTRKWYHRGPPRFASSCHPFICPPKRKAYPAAAAIGFSLRFASSLDFGAVVPLQARAETRKGGAEQ